MDNGKILLAAVAGSVAALIWCGIDASSPKEEKNDWPAYEYDVSDYEYTPSYDYDIYDYSYDTSDDGLTSGVYWCMGKGDTCPNKTYSAYDFYCSSCDPDGDNIEG